MSAPEELAGYRILRPLGQGGQATVYLAEAQGVGKQVALKVFPASERERYARELETYRALEAERRERPLPELVEGLAAGELADGGGFVALRYEAGGTLAERVAADGPLPLEAALAALGAVLRGLEALHALGRYHRDVKPHNVLLGADGQARLGDFGFAGVLDATVSSGGTPAFAAPEQWALGDAVPRDGAAIDVYGAGATLYFLLTGSSPLPGAPDVFLMERRGVPRWLQATLLRALDPRPGGRYPDVVRFRQALAPPAPATGGGRLLLLAALGLALLVGVAVTFREGAGAATARQGDSLAAETSAPPRSEDEPPPVERDPGPAEPAPSEFTRPTLTLRPDADGATVAWSDGRTLTRVDAGLTRLGALASGHAFVAHVDLQGNATLRAFDPQGGDARTALPAAPALLEVDAAGARAALALSDGSLWRLAPDAPPARLGAFPYAVRALRWEPDALIAEGDERQPTLLAAGAEPPPGSRVVEGSLGRYAFPREPQVATRRFAW
ncbi:MAG: serine/threonine-protein kinase [Planctomycetota bacterium]